MEKKPSWIDEFKTFIMRGNVLDMAVGVVVGGAFTAIVTSIVENLLTPLLGLLIPDSTFAEWAPGGFGIGAAINAIITFLITAFVVFWIVKAVNKLTPKKEEEPAPEAPAGPTTEELLTEIRDLLKQQEQEKNGK
ncbi:MAG: large conductance mechanosensitive channel protein MscL [Clostridiales bacterium]|nr:large conductance mechanosensitive channel protein MscL [Clostridiales bacterium]